MKIVGTICLCVFSIGFFSSSAHAQSSWEVQGSLGRYFPGGDLWDHANAIEAKLICWTTDQFGVGFTAGSQDWEADTGTQNHLFSAGNYDLLERYEGDLECTPLGISAFLRSDPQEKVNVTVEGGIQYVFADSDIKYERSGTVWQGGLPVAQRQQFSSDIDDGVVGHVAANLQYLVNPSFGFLVTLGYQFNVVEGDISTTVSSINALQPNYEVKDDNDLSGLYVMFGLRILF